MDILEILKADYQRFPEDQTYAIYANDVYFKDPLNSFRGIERYRRMIGWMHRWFQPIRLELHSIERQQTRIVTTWTLSWQAPLPWKPHIVIDGWSELDLDTQGQIAAHTDHWRCSPNDVAWQHLGFAARLTPPASASK
ncbi:DUF2358 domain-containing protein [Gloeobacter violaceus]|nr:DUF2358 domain-containing protein [Gloeobacter violaceus]